MVRRIDELQVAIAEEKASLASSGVLSDPTRPERRLLGLIDELTFIVDGQFKELSKVKARVRQLESHSRAK